MTTKTLDEVLHEWACSCVCPNTMAPTNEYEMRAVKQAMYNGLRLLQMSQGVEPEAERLKNAITSARVEAEYHRADYDQRRQVGESHEFPLNQTVTESSSYWRGRRDEAGFFRDRLDILLQVVPTL